MGSGNSRLQDKKADGRGDSNGAHNRKFQSYHLPFQKKKKFAKLKARLFGKKKPKAETCQSIPTTNAGARPTTRFLSKDLNKSSGISTSLQALPSSVGPRANVLYAAHSQHIFNPDSAESRVSSQHCGVPTLNHLEKTSDKTTLPMPSPELQCATSFTVRNNGENDDQSLPNELVIFRKNEDAYAFVVKEKSKITEIVSMAKRESSSGSSLFEDATEGDLPCEFALEAADSKAKLVKESSQSTEPSDLVFVDATDVHDTIHGVQEKGGDNKPADSKAKLVEESLHLTEPRDLVFVDATDVHDTIHGVQEKRGDNKPADSKAKLVEESLHSTEPRDLVVVDATDVHDTIHGVQEKRGDNKLLENPTDRPATDDIMLVDKPCVPLGIHAPVVTDLNSDVKHEVNLHKESSCLKAESGIKPVAIACITPRANVCQENDEPNSTLNADEMAEFKFPTSIDDASEIHRDCLEMPRDSRSCSLSSNNSDSPPRFVLLKGKRPKTGATCSLRKLQESDSSDERSGSAGDDGRAFYSSESDLVSDPLFVATHLQEGIVKNEDKSEELLHVHLEEFATGITNLINGDRDHDEVMPRGNSGQISPLTATETAFANKECALLDIAVMPVVDQNAIFQPELNSVETGDSCSASNSAKALRLTESRPCDATQKFPSIELSNVISDKEIASHETELPDSTIEHNLACVTKSDAPLMEKSCGTCEMDMNRPVTQLACLEETQCCDGQLSKDLIESAGPSYGDVNYSDYGQIPVSVMNASFVYRESDSSSGELKASVSMATSNSSGSDITDDIWDEDLQNEKTAEGIKTKLVLDLLKKLEVDMGDFDSFTELPGDLEDKYHVLSLREFLINNLELKFSLNDLSRCFRVLAKYGLNLLKAGGEEGQHWRKVIIPPKMLLGHWLCVQGSKEILMELGYEESNCNLVYPEEEEPNVETTAAWVVEMLLAAHEINVYCMGTHPHPEMFNSLIEASDCNFDANKMINTEEEMASSNLPSTETTTESHVDNLYLKKEDCSDSDPVCSVSCLPDNEDKHILPITSAVEEKYPLNKEENENNPDMFGRRTVVPWLMEKEKRLPDAPTQQRCHLCGSSSPAVRCEKCSNLIFCMSCDDMYHRHPKRRDHTRKSVNASVSMPPPLPPPRPPSKNADPNKVPVPPPRRRKSQRSIPNSPVFGRRTVEQKPELPKKQFPNLKFGSLKRFIPGANSGRPPISSPKEQYPTNMSHRDCPNETGGLLIDAKYGVGPGRLQESRCNYQDRQPISNYPYDSSLPRFQGRSNVADQSSSDAEEDCIGPCNMSGGSGSYVGSGPREEQWSPSSAGPPLPPHYGGMASRSIASLNHLGSYPEPGCGISTLSRRNTMMSGTLERNAGYGYPRSNFMQHSNSVCDLSNTMIHPPYVMGYRIPQAQSMADLQQGEMGPMAAPCGCRPNWIGPDAFGQWHPPATCMVHSANANTLASGMKPQQPSFHQGFASTDGMFAPIAHPLMYPFMAPSNSPMGYSSPNSYPPVNPQISRSTSNNCEQRAASPTASNTSAGSRNKPKEAPRHSRTSNRRPRPLRGTTSSEEDYYSAGTSDEDKPLKTTSEDRRSKDTRHSKASSGSWECEHCTFINKPDTRICNVCCKTTGHVKLEQKGVARKSPSASVNKEMEVEAPEIDGEQFYKNSESETQAQNQPSRSGEKLSKFNKKNRPEEDDGEYEDLDGGQVNRTKSRNEKGYAKEVLPERQNSQSKSIKENAGKNASNTTFSRAVEVATDPMEIEESPTINCVQSDTQTYSSVFREKILPASNSLSKTNVSSTSQKNVMSKGTSPPPQSISTQTPHADVWTSPEPQKSSLGRTSSRMSLSGDTSELNRGGGYHPTSSVLKRATSLHFPRSYGSINDGGSNWGIGYNSGSMIRSGSRSSLMSDHHFGYNLSSGPPSRDASPPPPVQRNIVSRRESNIERGQVMYPNFSRTVDEEDRNIRNGSRNDYYLSLEELVEKRRQETLRSQGLELVKLLREAEQQNFSADDLQVALNHCGSQNPVQWLQDNWKNMVDTVVTLATNYGNDKKKNDIGVMSSTEAKESLRLHKGNIWAAVTECVEQRQKRFAELQARGNFSRDEVVAALTSNQGNVELAYEDLNKASLKPFLMRIWGPPSGVENESGITWDALQAIQKVQNDSSVKNAWKDSRSLGDYNPIAHTLSNNFNEDYIKMNMNASVSNEGESSLDDPLDSVDDGDIIDNNAGTSDGGAEKSEAKDEEFFDAVPGTPSEEPYEMESHFELIEAYSDMSPISNENSIAKDVPASQQLSSPITQGQSSVILTSSATITLEQPVPSFPTNKSPMYSQESSNRVMVSAVQLSLEPILKPHQPVAVSDSIDEAGTEVLQVSNNLTESQPVDNTLMDLTDLDKLERVPSSEVIPQLDNDRARDDDLSGNITGVVSTREELNRKIPLREIVGVTLNASGDLLTGALPASITECDVLPSTHLPVQQKLPEESTNIPRRTEATVNSLKVMENSTIINNDVKVKRIPEVTESDLSRRVRQFLAEGKLPSYEKAEVAIKLIDLRFDESEAIYAAKECSDLYMAVSYLQQDCELCTGKFPMGKMISMLNCIHRCCHNCAKDYFTLKIKERNIMEAVCPFCNEPNLNDDEIAVDYFNNLDIVLKNLVDSDTHELFQRKLRDRALMNDPNFHWCHKCASGFITEPNRRRLVCPDCKVITCAECKKPWEKQHDGISCQKFLEWKQDNDPENQLVGLEKYLAENGIDCPKCKFKYALAKGGCMHFTCSQCKFEFCSGCGRPFRMAKKCGVSQRCERLGLHAHHPRNCLFYLRDKEPKDLLKLLDDHGISYHIDIQSTDEDEGQLRKCPVIEQKELPDGVEDSKCGRDVAASYPGLCRIHYIEYLGGILFKNKVDPIALLSEDNLEAVIRNSGRRLPPRTTHVRNEEYRQKMRKYLVSLINNNALDPVTIMDIGGLQQELKRKEKHCPDKEENEQDEQYRNKLVQLILNEIPLAES